MRTGTKLPLVHQNWWIWLLLVALTSFSPCMLLPLTLWFCHWSAWVVFFWPAYLFRAVWKGRAKGILTFVGPSLQSPPNIAWHWAWVSIFSSMFHSSDVQGWYACILSLNATPCSLQVLTITSVDTTKYCCDDCSVTELTGMELTASCLSTEWRIMPDFNQLMSIYPTAFTLRTQPHICATLL